jgi:hypothetical protein
LAYYRAIVLVRPISACFVAVYAEPPELPTSPAAEERLMILPHPFFIIYGSEYFVI